MTKIRALLSVLFIFLFVDLGMAISVPIYDVGTRNCKLDDFTVGVLVDDSRTLGIEDISKMDASFRQVQSRYMVEEIRKDYWFKLRLKNSSDQVVDRIVGFDEVFMRKVDVFYQKDSNWHHDHSGLSVPMRDRSFENRCFLFEISFQPGELKTVYLKMDTDFALVTGITVEDTRQFFLDEQKRTMAYWCYFGAAIAIFIYNLFLFFSIREKVYLYYVIYAGSFIVFAFLYSGYSQYAISNEKLLYDLDASLGLMGVFVVLFTRELLNTRKVSKRIDNVLIAIASVYALFAILIPVDILIFKWLTVYGIPSVIFLLFTGVYCWMHGMPLAKYYVVAMTGYFVGLIMISALQLELVPYNTLTRYGFMLGSFVELLVFSLILGYRVKMLQDDKNMYHLQLLSVQKGMTEKLERQVKERTEALSVSLNELNVTNDKLEKLLSFNEDMTSMIVHDLKVPLNFIINETISSSGESSAKRIKQSAYKMFNLVQNMLDVYRFEQASMNLAPSNLNISSIIRDAFAEVEYLTFKKAIVVTVDMDAPVTIVADEMIIKRVFVNLLSNAVKHSPVNGELVISIMLQDDNKVKVSIRNEGGAIPQDKQKAIFGKFVQLGADSSGLHSSGLGLAFCQLAVESHGGDIGVYSDSEHSSTFWFTVAASRADVGSTDAFELQPAYAICTLSENELKRYDSQLSQLRDVKFYEISKIRRLLSDFDDDEASVKEWKEAVLLSSNNGNGTLYSQLINHGE